MIQPLIARSPLVAVIALLCTYTSTTQATLARCSKQSTGISSTHLSSDYQSNGLCSDTCNGYTYAILFYKDCWCSNTAPSSTVDLSLCEVDCPGYPSEKCGDSNAGYYGYVQLKADPDSSTTAGTSATTSSTTTGTSPSTTTSSSSSSSSTKGTSTSTSTSSTSTSTSTSSSKTSISTSPSSSPSSSSSSAAATTTTLSSITSTSKSKDQNTSASPTTAVSTVSPVVSYIYSIMTITGSQQIAITTTQVISTQVSQPTTSLSANTKSNDNTNKGFFQSPGKVAGTFVAVGVVVLAIVGTLLYCFCFAASRRSNNGAEYDDDEEESNISSHHNEKIIGGNTPPLPHVPPTINITSPGSVSGPGSDDIAGVMGPGIPRLSTNSMEDDFMEVDQRLDPRQMFMNWENGSRRSLADDTDYSRRVLRVTND